MTQHVRKSYLGIMIYVAAILMISGSAFANIEDTIEKSFTVKPGGTLKVDTKRGSIEVEGHRGSTVEVKVIREVKTSDKEEAQKLLEKFLVDFDQRGDDITITATYDERNIVKKLLNDMNKKLHVKFVISVPDVYNVDLQTSGGSIGVRGLEGRILGRTSGGSMTFDGITGDIEGRTSGGSIKIGNVEGDTDIHTSGGSITIEKAAGKVDAHTSGGSITVHEVMGAIQADTSGGSIKAYISRQPADSCRLTTSGGSLTVYMADDVSVDVNARTSGGRVNTEFPVTVQGEIKPSNLQAKINGGGPELYLRTSGGSIYLKKK
ncbi:MAG: hypothetical protein WBB73_14605 [Candidatus Aminicenantaceae bacterium]